MYRARITKTWRTLPDKFDFDSKLVADEDVPIHIIGGVEGMYDPEEMAFTADGDGMVYWLPPEAVQRIHTKRGHQLQMAISKQLRQAILEHFKDYGDDGDEFVQRARKLVRRARTHDELVEVLQDSAWDYRAAVGVAAEMPESVPDQREFLRALARTNPDSWDTQEDKPVWRA